MTTDLDAPLPRWGRLTEPMTVLTNVALSIVAFVLGARLAYQAAAFGTASAAAIAFGFLVTAVAAAFGAAAHGIDPRVDRPQRDRCWNLALAMTGLIAASCIVSVAYFAARGASRKTVLAFAVVKLVAFVVGLVVSWRRTAQQPLADAHGSWRMKFAVAVIEYGTGLLVLLLGAAYAWIRWRASGTGWIMAGILISTLGGVIQARRLALHRHFNHNDLYHVIQAFAIYALYRGGAQLVDR